MKCTDWDDAGGGNKYFGCLSQCRRQPAMGNGLERVKKTENKHSGIASEGPAGAAREDI